MLAHACTSYLSLCLHAARSCALLAGYVLDAAHKGCAFVHFAPFGRQPVSVPHTVLDQSSREEGEPLPEAAPEPELGYGQDDGDHVVAAGEAGEEDMAAGDGLAAQGAREREPPAQHFSQLSAALSPKASPFLRCPGTSLDRTIHYDPMHCLCGVIKDTVVKVLLGFRWTDAMRSYEHATLKRFTGHMSRGPGQLPEEGLQRMKTALHAIAQQLPVDTGAKRLVRLMDPGKKTKAHTYLMLAGVLFK